MFFRPGRKDASPKERAIWGDLMSLGMVFPIAIAAGFFVGRWVGGLLGHPKAGLVVGLAWGVATGFWELYKVTVRLDRWDQEEHGKQDPPEDGRSGDDRPGGDHGPGR